MSASPLRPSPPPNPVLSYDRGPKHSLVFCKNGIPVTKLEFNSFEALLLALAELLQLAAEGASVDKVEIEFNRERLKEQQCEELAAIMACRIPLKKVLIMTLANTLRRKTSHSPVFAVGLRMQLFF